MTIIKFLKTQRLHSLGDLRRTHHRGLDHVDTKKHPLLLRQTASAAQECCHVRFKRKLGEEDRTQWQLKVAMPQRGWGNRGWGSRGW